MDYSKKMGLAEAMWNRLQPVFEAAINAGRHFSVKFDAYRKVTVDGNEKDREAVENAIHTAEEIESARIGEPISWDLRTIHYLKKHVVTHVNIGTIHNVDTDTSVSVDWSECYIFTV